MENNNFADVPEWLTRYCEIRGMSVAKFFEIQEKWSVYFDQIRLAFSVGVFEDSNNA